VLPHGATTLAVRALLDRTILEVFIGNGRLAITSAVGAPPPTARGAYVTAHSAVGVAGASAWEMGCGWADDTEGRAAPSLLQQQPQQQQQEEEEEDKGTQEENTLEKAEAQQQEIGLSADPFTVTKGVCPDFGKYDSKWTEYKGTHFDTLAACEATCKAANCSSFTWNHAVKPRQCWGYSGAETRTCR
jgi:hypothetical protein